MAPPHFETKLLEIVPKFDGNHLDICVSKDWKTVKDALIAHFGDQRNENGLLFDLDQLRQYANEPPLQFHTRGMSNLSASHNYIDTHNFNDPTSLKEPLGSTIRSMKPKDLAEARKVESNISNIRHLQKPQNDNFANKNKHQNQQKQNFHQNNFPRFHNFQQNYTPTQTFQPPGNTFPHAPINVNPRQMPTQKFFTNQQVFGSPKNVWKPNAQEAQNLPKLFPGLRRKSASENTPNEFPNRIDIVDIIRTQHMNEEEKFHIEKLFQKYSDIFHLENQPLTFTNQVEHRIKTTDELPVYTKSY
ncbi:unnamed protein product [Ceutorhynchus assimilis]|uniref:Uncharacterized protein n=1 Tax=Ceutorhynchus assimilis TaxID=467358 RepID=A0A9N9MTN3_9CUCU|nr:unnamed protein product [Ceutorhynchus assimilis]